MKPWTTNLHPFGYNSIQGSDTYLVASRDSVIVFPRPILYHQRRCRSTFVPGTVYLQHWLLLVLVSDRMSVRYQLSYILSPVYLCIKMGERPLNQDQTPIKSSSPIVNRPTKRTPAKDCLYGRGLRTYLMLSSRGAIHDRECLRKVL